MKRGRPFTIEEERYLLAQIGGSNPRVTQRALQWLCERASKGTFFTNPQRIRSTIRMVLYSPDLKVRRWALNALAEIGIGGDVTIITSQIPVASEDPDLMISVVRTLFSQQTDEAASTLLARLGVPLEGANLIAAASNSANQMARLRAERIPLDNADDEELRAAIVLTGKRRAPENLFLADHPNSVALSELNLHDTPSVSKYSMWAQAELKLGFRSLKIPISRFDSSPPEVRKWYLRVLFSDPDSLGSNLDLVKHAQNDNSEEVREEAAIELRETFVADMAPAVLMWYGNEPHDETRFALLEHMATNADFDVRYERLVTEIYQQMPSRSESRIRLEAAAAGTALHGKLRKISIVEEGQTLFGRDNEEFGRRPMVTINQNFTNSQIGAVTGSGNISAETITAVQGVQSADLRMILERALGLINQLPNEKQQVEGGKLVQEVAQQPTKPGLQRLIGFFTTAKKGVDAASGLATSVDGLIGDISDLSMMG